MNRNRNVSEIELHCRADEFEDAIIRAADLIKEGYHLGRVTMINDGISAATVDNRWVHILLYNNNY